MKSEKPYIAFSRREALTYLALFLALFIVFTLISYDIGYGRGIDQGWENCQPLRGFLTRCQDNLTDLGNAFDTLLGSC